MHSIDSGLDHPDSELSLIPRLPMWPGNKASFEPCNCDCVTSHLCAGKVVNIHNAYKHPKFFKDVDKSTGFRTRSAPSSLWQDAWSSLVSQCYSQAPLFHCCPQASPLPQPLHPSPPPNCIGISVLVCDRLKLIEDEIEVPNQAHVRTRSVVMWEPNQYPREYMEK